MFFKCTEQLFFTLATKPIVRRRRERRRQKTKQVMRFRYESPNICVYSTCCEICYSNTEKMCKSQRLKFPCQKKRPILSWNGHICVLMMRKILECLSVNNRVSEKVFSCALAYYAFSHSIMHSTCVAQTTISTFSITSTQVSHGIKSTCLILWGSLCLRHALHKSLCGYLAY